MHFILVYNAAAVMQCDGAYLINHHLSPSLLQMMLLFLETTNSCALNIVYDHTDYEVVVGRKAAPTISGSLAICGWLLVSFVFRVRIS